MIAIFALLALLATANAQCASGGVLAGSTCWYIAFFNSASDNCVTACADVGGIPDSDAILNFGGSGAADPTGCQAIADAFQIQASVVDVNGAGCQGAGLGCFFNIGQTLRCTAPSTTDVATASFPGGGRFCACDIAASSGFTDPHFSGFNGEQLDIKHDNEAANHFFNIFCRENVAINALFSPNVEDLLYMTKFTAKFGEFEMEMDLFGFSASGKYELASKSDEETRYTIQDGSVKIEKDDVVVKHQGFTYHMKAAFVGEEKYLDVYFQGPRKGQSANGIVGRSLTRQHTSEEFSEYSHFSRQSETDFSCEL